MKKIDTDELVNKWLEDYHNTNLDKVLVDNGWKNGENRAAEFYDKYEVTQEQHDEWYKWAVKFIAKSQRVSQKYVRDSMGFIYLNAAPKIKDLK